MVVCAPRRARESRSSLLGWTPSARIGIAIMPPASGAQQEQQCATGNRLPLAGDPRGNCGSERSTTTVGRDDAETHRYQIGVLRHPQSRGGSIAVHDEWAEGQLIRIGAPRNRFALVPARRSLLLAGGIGITPILCMAERLARDGAAFEMHYCTRSAARLRARRGAHAEQAPLVMDGASR
jgi:hypothetical protein